MIASCDEQTKRSNTPAFIGFSPRDEGFGQIKSEFLFACRARQVPRSLFRVRTARDFAFAHHRADTRRCQYSVDSLVTLEQHIC